MNELTIALKIVLANTFAMYFKAHSYHWNVEGINFSQYHSFFGDLYEEVYGAIDPIAEQIRALDQYAPVSLSDMMSAATIDEDADRQVTLMAMLQRLLVANEEIVSCRNKTFDLAQQQNHQGLMNFLADRLDTHAKHGWMIRASQKAIAGV